MAKKKATKVNFSGLLSDMKRQPKDAKGRFKDRDFAKYVSRKLAEVRSGKKQLKIKFKPTKRK